MNASQSLPLAGSLVPRLLEAGPKLRFFLPNSVATGPGEKICDQTPRRGGILSLAAAGWSFFVASDSLCSVAMAASPCPTCWPASRSHRTPPRTAVIFKGERDHLLPEALRKGKATFALVPRLEVKAPAQ